MLFFKESTYFLLLAHKQIKGCQCCADHFINKKVYLTFFTSDAITVLGKQQIPGKYLEKQHLNSVVNLQQTPVC